MRPTLAPSQRLPAAALPAADSQSSCARMGGGVFLVLDAVTGQVLAVMQENRFLTDVRTGAAGAVAIKHLAKPEHTKVGFIGTGQVPPSPLIPCMCAT